VRTIYYNTGEVAQWPFAPSGEWPKGSGHEYLDGVCVLVAAEVVAPGNGQTVHPLETEYREEMSKDPVTGQIWGFEPCAGVRANSPTVTSPAINRDTTTFPPSWPIATGVGPEYNGYWYGYFGKGVSNADFETFFVMDDSKDQKFTRPPYSFYPLASDSTREGSVCVWKCVGSSGRMCLQKILFSGTTISLISPIETWTRPASVSIPIRASAVVNSGNDDASYSTSIDLCYAWDHLRRGDPAYGSWIPGMYGYAYLESPGNPWNGIDDDEDGMIDERRDNGIDENHNWTVMRI